MNVSTSINHESLDVLSRNITQLTQKIANKLNAQAVREAAKPIRDLMRDIAPRQETPWGGTLQSSIDMTVRTKKGVTTAYVGPRTKIRKPIKLSTKGKSKGQVQIAIPTRYAHLQEFGSSRQPARPFVRPAWDEYGGEVALNTYADVLIGGVQDEVNRMQGKVYK